MGKYGRPVLGDVFVQQNADPWHLAAAAPAQPFGLGMGDCADPRHHAR
jgi:hypothetical protein